MIKCVRNIQYVSTRIGNIICLITGRKIIYLCINNINLIVGFKVEMKMIDLIIMKYRKSCSLMKELDTPVIFIITIRI